MQSVQQKRLKAMDALNAQLQLAVSRFNSLREQKELWESGRHRPDRLSILALEDELKSAEDHLHRKAEEHNSLAEKLGITIK